MKLVMLFVQINSVKSTDCKIMVISRFAANMVKTRQKSCYIAEHAANALHRREQLLFLDFIYQMKKLSKLFITRQRVLV